MMLPLLIGCSGKQETKRIESNDRDSLTITMVAADTISPFALLQSEHQVEYVTSANGVFVTGIDSVSGSTGHFWIISVNDTMPKVASDKMQLEVGDTVRWHYRRSQ
jgi:hypothetical protein